MLNINLLPKDRKKQAPGRQPIAPFIFSFILLVFSIGAFYFLIQQNIDSSTIDLERIEKNIAMLNKEVKDYDQLKSELDNNKLLIKEIEKINDRSLILITTLSQLKKSLPASLEIKGLTVNSEAEDNIRLSAVTSSPRVVALFKKQVDGLDWIQRSILSSITNNEGVSSFSLDITIKNDAFSQTVTPELKTTNLSL